MARPKTHDEALRTRLLDRAGELLSTVGPKGLSLRKLAADVHTSTTAVYSLFGGKPELVSAVYVEGFRRFGNRLAAVERTGDPAADMISLGLAYRESALADPNLYPIMFTGSVPGFEPDEDAKKLAHDAVEVLEEVVRAGIATGVFADVDPGVMTIGCWGISHGLVTLELSGNLPGELDVGAAYETALRANVSGWLKR